ncbi:hypothetical protein [Nocardioides sp. Leaf285]|uniref:hypothetical protein n=1 Tax=Nocardioides sp. Leaf285 TaxID=1736322 RepID=UPI000702C8E7|nr:hypothetical protein [Nocardioides sp. Leaf285]KQP63061.1 hypothetical protein ASF47_18795 [Nocardioides sp. Leaf285]
MTDEISNTQPDDSPEIAQESTAGPAAQAAAVPNLLAPLDEDYDLPLAAFDSEEPQAPSPGSASPGPAAVTPSAGAAAIGAEDALLGAGDDITQGISALLAKEPVWSVAEYFHSGNFGGAARKLSESFVAPLVAAARGYRTYSRDTDADPFKDFRLGDKRSNQARRLINAILLKDALLMPWYAVDEVYRSAARSEALTASAIQFRPSAFPQGEEDGERQRKYEFVQNSGTPISMHPAIPGHWLDTAPVTLIAEGLLKADAALTGWLLSKGVSREQLGYDGTFDARMRLTAMMETIPADEGLAICSIAGVYNWQQNPEWKMLAFTGRDVWLGIDGDVATNPYVWKAAAAFKEFLEQKKRATVSMLSPQIPTESADGTTDEKIGIDDYLAEHGTWDQLLQVLAPTMPPRPADGHASEGDVRIHQASGNVWTERWKVVESDATGQPILGRWEKVVPLGGRIIATLAERIPSEAETRTGEFGKGVDESQTEWEVEIEIKFKSPAEDSIESHVITGPAKILNYLPDQWEAKGADIPAPVLVHPEWPPRAKEGEAWLKAIKSNEPEQVIQRVRWASMGWIPVPGAVPAFIAGEHVIGGDEDAHSEVIAGVTSEHLDRAHAFGMGTDYGSTYDDPEYRAEVKRAIEAMLGVYVTNGVWRDRRNAAVVVAAGLRPALPLHMRALPYFVGARGTGKTFSAEAAMAFWQAEPGSLIPIPGSAKDTAAHMELSISRSVIWCIDDLAPASSRRQSEDEKDKIGNLIRNYFNRTARGRSNANMGNRKKNLPRAMLMITAENEPTVSSERDRVVLCDIGYGALSVSREPTRLLDQMVKTTTHPDSQAPARCAQALVKYLRWEASRSSWAATYDMVANCMAEVTDMATQRMERTGGTKRHIDTSADLMVSLMLLLRVATEVHCEDWVLDLLGGDDSLQFDVVDLISEGQRQNNETSPGRALVEALSATLRRGRAHIVLSDNPSTPPMTADAQICSSLGWVRSPDGQTWRPPSSSEPIGWLVYDRQQQPVIIFDAKTAFSLAQTHYPGLIPHGQQERSSWAAVTGEGLGRKDMLRKDGEKLLNRARVMSKNVTRSGYPIDLDRVLRGGLDEEDAMSLDSDG